MLLKLFKMLIGILLLPLCWAISLAVYTLYQTSIGAEAGGMEVWALPVGFVIWVVIFFLLPRPVRTYVLGHELTHALWALMMGGRIGRIKVGKQGGHVELSKTNFVITLAPYFFPFYTFLVIGAYYLVGIWFEQDPYRIWWLAAIGLTWSFHLTFTIDMLTQRQPDIQEHGRIFSYVVIYSMNVLAIGIWMVLIGAPTFSSFGELLHNELMQAYTYSWEQISIAWVYAEHWIQELSGSAKSS